MSGWEPKRFTRYEYEDGVLVGSVTEQEPEYSRIDVEALIALVESQRVGPHGYPMNEAMSPAGDPSNPDREWDWDVGLPSIDFAQAAVDRAIDQYRTAYPDADMSSLKWAVKKRVLPTGSSS